MIMVAEVGEFVDDDVSIQSRGAFTRCGFRMICPSGEQLPHWRVISSRRNGGASVIQGSCAERASIRLVK